jgi:hypothetical protein
MERCLKFLNRRSFGQTNEDQKGKKTNYLLLSTYKKAFNI